jgi:hypothetical protein
MAPMCRRSKRELGRLQWPIAYHGPDPGCEELPQSFRRVPYDVVVLPGVKVNVFEGSFGACPYH